MKRILIGSLLAMASLSALAEAPGGPSCGWGNMLFEGQRGGVLHGSWRVSCVFKLLFSVSVANALG
jgi:ABC-type dipeptide/oligopeptide/nickel transport system permease subunit